jgi:hypothetical protein
MTSVPNELIRDPLFQLNALLWLAQSMPSGSEIRPLLYEQGFTVYAIAPLLGLPPDLRLMTQEARINMQESVRPDVVLAQEGARKFAFTECKKSSFGATSSTAEQGRSLLVVAGPRAAEALGLAPGQVADSLLAFITAQSEQVPLTQTLETLSKQLHAAKIPAARFSVLGLVSTETEVSVAIDDQASAFFALPSGIYPFLTRGPDTDPRPLYFIPYDPDVDQSQEEREFCKLLLFERMRNTVVAAVGRGCPPCELSFNSKKILNDAMCGMYGQWENQESAKHMRRLCRQLMGALMQAVNSEAPSSLTFQPDEGWKIILQNSEQQEKVLDALTHFSCETLALETEPQPGLFDDLEEGTGQGGGE